MCGRERILWLGLYVVLVAGAPPLAGQVEPATLPSPRLAVVSGVVDTDFGAVDPADGGWLVGLRLDFPLSSIVVLEPSAERLALDADGETSVRWQLDFGARVEVPVGPLRPYLGGALGTLFWPGESRPTEADFVVATYGGMVGARVDVTRRLGARAEARLRWLDGLESRISAFDAGVSWRF